MSIEELDNKRAANFRQLGITLASSATWWRAPKHRMFPKHVPVVECYDGADIHLYLAGLAELPEITQPAPAKFERNTIGLFENLAIETFQPHISNQVTEDSAQSSQTASMEELWGYVQIPLAPESSLREKVAGAIVLTAMATYFLGIPLFNEIKEFVNTVIRADVR